ncbi:MAG: hypothetical protein ACTSXX_01505 [Candidatus Baldrarchaeia archaeon]
MRMTAEAALGRVAMREDVERLRSEMREEIGKMREEFREGDEGAERRYPTICGHEVLRIRQ